ncbi:MAG: RNA polymerase sigma factor SigJ [Kordiimonas sp.]
MGDTEESIRIFEENRSRLLGLAYRILGIMVEAEDAVQDTCVKWLKADHADIRTPAAWLTTVCTRRAIDMLRAAHKSRVDYFGIWLPEPVRTAETSGAVEDAELASSLSTAFLLMLERLSPKERAAYLLYDVFSQPYSVIADTLDIEEAACRKLVSRARGHVSKEDIRHSPSKQAQEKLLRAFHGAIESGETDTLAGLLSEDIKLASDGGGKVIAVPKIVVGKRRILRFISRGLHRAWAGAKPVLTELNGRVSAIYTDDDGTISTLSFEYDKDGLGAYIYIVRNPDKLTALDTQERLV